MTNSTARSDSDLQGHTPGPWHVSKGSAHYVCCDGSWIASTMGIGGPEGEANARLIAAAPELLEALIEVRRVGDDKMAFRSEWVAAVRKADAALAKARGAS